ncbi:MAG: hypothetical protein AAB152_03950 [Candidatus Coatesbacteria bacterium]
MNHRWRTVLALAVLAAAGISRPASAACPDLILLGTTDYNGSANDHDAAWAVAVDGSGNVVVVGYEFISPTKANWRIRKYDASLTTLLATTDYDGGAVNGTDAAHAVAIDGSGNILVAGSMYSGGTHCMIRKYDPMLTTLLAATEYAAAADARGLILDGSGNVVVAGEGGSPASGNDWRITKFDPALTTVLTTTDFSSPGFAYDMLWALAQDGSGNIIAAGTEGDQFSPFTEKWRIRKYDASLTTLLASTDYIAGTGFSNAPSAVVVGAGGNILVVGIEDGVWQMRIREYNASLTTLLATTVYAGPGTNELGRSAALDSRGNLVVVGEEQGLSCGSNWRIGKYDASLTTMLATTTYEACHNPGDNAGPWAIAVDGRDNLMVAGYETDSTGYHNWRINKYGQPACLDAVLAFSRTIVSPGQWVTVMLTVTNAGGAVLNGIPTLGQDAGPGTGAITAGPTPSATTVLPTGQSMTFTWSFSASGAGLVELTGTLTGWDLSLSATTWVQATGSFLIQKRPALSASLVMTSASSLLPGDAIVLVFTVSNSGEAGATVTPRLPKVSGSGTGYLALSPVALVVPGGGSVSFTWVYTAGPAASSLSFTASGNGTDVNSGVAVPVPQGAAGPVVVTAPSTPCVSAPTRITFYDGRANGDDEGNGIAVPSSGSIFVACEENREESGRLTDCLVIGYPPGGGALYWAGEYGAVGSVADAAYGVTTGPDGSVYSVGHSGNSAWIERWDPFPPGAMDWILLLAESPGGPDELRSVMFAPDGNLVVAGKQRRTDIGHGDDVWVAKYDPTGGLVWSVNYNSPANSDDLAYAVTVDLSGSIYVAGAETRTDLGQGRNILVLKYSASGALLWTRSYTSPGIANDEGRAIAVDGTGNLYVGGYETRNDLGQGENGWVRKCSPAGTPLWTATFNSPMTRFGGPNDRALGIAVDPVNGDVFATGRVERPGQAANVLFARWDASGTLLDLQTRNGPNNGNDEGRAITVGPGDDLYVAGFENWDNLAQKENVTTYQWPRPGCLKAALSVSPVPVWSGLPIEVVLTVTNTGANAVTSVTPVLTIAPGAGLLSLLTAPSPLASLGPGASAFFTWTYATAGTGPVACTATVTGVESVSGLSMTAWGYAETLVQGAASLAGAVSLPASTCQAMPFTLAVTITNTGLGGAWLGSATVLVTGLPASALGGPVPPLPLTLGVGNAVTLAWTWSAAGAGAATFSVTVTGADLTGGGGLAVGPLGADIAVTGRAALEASARATPAAAVGGGITVELTVTNTGLTMATGLTPALAVSPPGAPVLGWAGPSPPGPVALAPGAAQTFAWSYTATGWGTVTFAMTVAGADSCGAISSAATATAFLGTPATLVGSVVSAIASPLCVGSYVLVVVSVTNTGNAPAVGVAGTTTLFIEGPGTASLQFVSNPVASLGPGASAHFTWQYATTGVGAIRFTATVAGTDAALGGPVRTAPLTTPTTDLTVPANIWIHPAVSPVVAMLGQLVTVTLTVTNMGGDAAGVSAAAWTIEPGMTTRISGPSPPGPIALPSAASQTFSWTFSASGAGVSTFTFSVTGSSCGGPVAFMRGDVRPFWIVRPALLVASGLTLAPGSPGAGATVVATMVLRNDGDLDLTVTSFSRTVVGVAGLGAPGAPTPGPGFMLTAGGSQSVTWTQTTTAPCGVAAETVSAAGVEFSTGRILSSNTVTSNAVSITGTATGFTLSASAAKANVGTPVTLTAMVTDACGGAVPNLTVTFTVSAGGGWLSAVTGTTNFSGRVTVTLTLGLDEGRNTVVAYVGGTTLTALVAVEAVNPLVLTSPGAALDKNVLVLNSGQVVLARIWPLNGDPIVTRIFTASGRLVRTLRKLTPSGRGQFLVEWDGLSEDEFAVARGVYLVDVEGGGIHQILKVLVR